MIAFMASCQPCQLLHLLRDSAHTETSTAVQGNEQWLRPVLVRDGIRKTGTVDVDKNHHSS